MVWAVPSGIAVQRTNSPPSSAVNDADGPSPSPGRSGPEFGHRRAGRGVEHGRAGRWLFAVEGDPDRLLGRGLEGVGVCPVRGSWLD
ncbi:hypothetical protein GJ629_05735 [Halapricum sp. CBA1109]|uniref:hypothetical protein n=1 Tax=Halapricum sp. CBA1109 TaxID=2668068 RepID=UPI0012FC3EBA|nr:hypothetical protein [Halapricum sp. CBA1109]MUV89459.1 hypothetical protein [Halapricum sp. CBA1109]